MRYVWGSVEAELLWGGGHVTPDSPSLVVIVGGRRGTVFSQHRQWCEQRLLPEHECREPPVAAPRVSGHFLLWASHRNGRGGWGTGDGFWETARATRILGARLGEFRAHPRAEHWRRYKATQRCCCMRTQLLTTARTTLACRQGRDSLGCHTPQAASAASAPPPTCCPHETFQRCMRHIACTCAARCPARATFCHVCSP